MLRIALQRPDLSRRWSTYGMVGGDNRNFKSILRATITNQIQDVSMSEKDTCIRTQAPQFVGRILARFDQEYYWAVAWLRAESHWEGRQNERYAENYKRKFAEQEFNSMRKRYNTQLGDNSTKCIVMANKEANSVVGTLDLSIHHFSDGETFPAGECAQRKGCSRYAYIANLCVAKSARRQGIGGGMLQYAILSAKLQGAEQVFVHVYKNNKAAQNLYQKMGFQVVNTATSQLSADHMYLLCYEILSIKC